MILVHVWITLPTGDRLRVGDLACSDADSHGFFESEFEYDRGWLAHPQAFDLVPGILGPHGLPRRQGRPFKAKQFHPPLGFIEDALPDTWGRSLLVRAMERNNPRLGPEQKQGAYLLIELSGGALGATAFSAQGAEPSCHPVMGSEHLCVLIQAAEDFERGRLKEGDALHRLLSAGGSPGGARPKALVEDESGQWIAKFPSVNRDEGCDVVGLEAAGMLVAKCAGLDVPDTKLVPLGKKRALLVRRFDSTPQGRRHMSSLHTLCAERPGIAAHTYSQLAERIRLVSAAPSKEVSALFRQMIYNAAIGNTDDHTKNFWMLRDAGGWHLSPAFDLVPNYHRRSEHQLAFQYERYCPSGATAKSIGQEWGVEASIAEIVKEVTDAARTLPSVARKLHVPQDQVQWFDSDIQRRCGRLLEGLT